MNIISAMWTLIPVLYEESGTIQVLLRRFFSFFSMSGRTHDHRLEYCLQHRRIYESFRFSVAAGRSEKIIALVDEASFEGNRL
jgi:hypothetical protein